MKNIPVLTVIYHENESHYNMALKAWAAFGDRPIVAVINRKLDGVEYPEHITYIENDENCLAKAWNIGLRHIFEKFDVAVVSGLDSIAPNSAYTNEQIKIIREHTQMGFLSSTPEGMESGRGWHKVQHGDGSFSFFIITRRCFNQVGDFDERYKPAYFEDNDYLERLWKKNFQPMRDGDVTYFHLVQGTIKQGYEIRKQYPYFMQKNLELFIKTYGKVPDHLPPEIRFA
jgi:hypothetical protein